MDRLSSTDDYGNGNNMNPVNENPILTASNLILLYFERGLPVTLYLSVLGFATAMLVGFVVGLTRYLKVCAENGGKAPRHLEAFLPWSMTEDIHDRLRQPYAAQAPPTPSLESVSIQDSS